jgi:hypothetical protein
VKNEVEDESEYMLAKLKDERDGDDMNFLKRKSLRDYKNMKVPFSPMLEKLYAPKQMR